MGAERISVVVVEGSKPQCIAPGSLPVVVCWVGDEFGGDGPDQADLVVGEDDIDDVIASIETAPLAAVTLALLLRASTQVGVDAGLILESAAYSMLQGGPEFASWRSCATADAIDDASETVVIRRDDQQLTITLNRPERHNAINTRLRDELSAALSTAVIDESISSIELNGNGPSFCSGGDLSEFGTRPDPAIAHVIRLARSPARIINQLREKTTAHVHGYTFGGGLEMAAFAGRIAAQPDTVFALPEIGLGLIPGAGGTVSLPRRIGRRRTAALALTGRRIDATTALDWGLIDVIAGR